MSKLGSVSTSGFVLMVFSLGGFVIDYLQNGSNGINNLIQVGALGLALFGIVTAYCFDRLDGWWGRCQYEKREKEALAKEAKASGS